MLEVARGPLVWVSDADNRFEVVGDIWFEGDE